MTWRWKLSGYLQRLQENITETLGEPNCNTVGLTGLMQVEPLERDVACRVSDAVVLVFDVVVVN